MSILTVHNLCSVNHLQLNPSMYLNHTFKDNCRIQLQNQISYLRLFKKEARRLKGERVLVSRRKSGLASALTCRGISERMSKRERERLHCARLHSVVYSSFGNAVVILSLNEEWRDWFAIHLRGRVNNFLSNKNCTKLSLVLAYNESVQNSDKLKCTVSVFALISIVQFKYTQRMYLK